MGNEAVLYLGKTIGFPVVLNQYGRPDIIEGEDTIPDSIQTILGNPKGSRFFLPQYGSDLDLLMFQPNDDILQSLLFTVISDALETWEKRIKVVDITFIFVDGKPDRLDCKIHYIVLKTNAEGTFIYPFYTEIIY